MLLNKANLKNITPQDGLTIPREDIFSLPETVLQFGTGVLLRGLPDYFIDKANRAGVFNGRIVVVKSTASGNTDAFDKQQGLYSLCVKGMENGLAKEETIINSSISRVVSAMENWQAILDLAGDPRVKLIISNTTEVGITLVQDDIRMSPPISFPGKLLAFLYERFRSLGGKEETGLVIVPTELIIDNGKKLKAILLELAEMNKLGKEFSDWLSDHNHFCNSLVDRIVPGALSSEDQRITEEKFGYRDELMIMAETFRLWAIESAEQKVKDVLSFAGTDTGVVIAPSIEKFRELKLRLLNGTHTFTCGLAFLSGFTTVKQAMDDEALIAYVKDLMLEEIGPAMLSEAISEADIIPFTSSVIERFRNPFLEHQWIAITMQYSSKMKMRNLPLILAHYKKTSEVPEQMAKGFAAFLLFMRGSVKKPYPIKDDNSAYFLENWEKHGIEGISEAILSDTAFWGSNPGELPGFKEAVKDYLLAMDTEGVRTILGRKTRHKTIVA